MARIKQLEAETFNGWNTAHRKLLAKMTRADIVKLIADGADVEYVNHAAVCIADGDLEAALRIYDAFLRVPFDDLERDHTIERHVMNVGLLRKNSRTNAVTAIVGPWQ